MLSWFLGWGHSPPAGTQSLISDPPQQLWGNNSFGFSLCWKWQSPGEASESSQLHKPRPAVPPTQQHRWVHPCLGVLGLPGEERETLPALFLAGFWPWRSRLEVTGSDPGPPPAKESSAWAEPRTRREEHHLPTFAPSRPWGPGGPRRPVLPCLGVKKNPGLTSFSPARCSWSQTCPPTPISNHPEGGQGHKVTYRPPSGSCRSCSAGDTDLALGQREGCAQRQELG